MVKAAIIRLDGDDRTGDVVRRTVADGTAISKGTLCKLSSVNTATAATGSGEPFAGIASTDKEASDGATTLGFFTNGVFDIAMDSAATGINGGLVCMSGADLLRAAVAGDILSGAIVGRLEETGTAGTVVRVKVGGF